MAAYLVYLCQGIDDREELEAYWRESPATYVGYSCKTLAVYTPFELLEGEGPIEGVVIAEFESMDEAKRWFNSPEYSAVRKHRERGARYLGLLVDGGRIADIKQRMIKAE